jgi:hypothetical protein
MAPDAPEEPMRPGVFGRLVHRIVSGRSYGLVLLLVLVSYAVGAMWSSDTAAMSVVMFIEIAAVWFALHVSQARPRVRRVATVLMVIVAIAAVLNLVAHEESFRWVIILAGLLYIIAPFSIIRHLAQRHTVDQETMMGAISAYLLFGIAFGFLYLELGNIQTNFWGNGETHVTMAQTFFFSFTTLTTTGYGNLVPAGNPGQTISVLEMILGQLFLITALGKIVTEWRPRGWHPDDPDVPGVTPPAQ